jgi:hypothetical protein
MRELDKLKEHATKKDNPYMLGRGQFKSVGTNNKRYQVKEYISSVRIGSMYQASIPELTEDSKDRGDVLNPCICSSQITS